MPPQEPHPHRLRLDDQLCFALYAATNAVTRAYKPKLVEIGVTYPQYLVLLVLWQDGSRTVTNIAARLRLPLNAMTPLIDRLERAGFVLRRRDPRDRRVIHIHLTAEGVALEGQAATAQNTVVCETKLSPEALGALREELRALAARLEIPETVSGNSR